MVASDHAAVARRMSRARYRRPRRVSRTKSWGGMAALISFRDLCTNERVRNVRVKKEGKGDVPWHGGVRGKRIFRVLLVCSLSSHCLI